MYKFYTTNKALPIIKQIRIIYKTDFAKATLDANNNTIIMYVAIKK